MTECHDAVVPRQQTGIKSEAATAFATQQLNQMRSASLRDVDTQPRLTEMVSSSAIEERR
jgi:hypothetical protein